MLLGGLVAVGLLVRCFCLVVVVGLFCFVTGCLFCLLTVGGRFVYCALAIVWCFAVCVMMVCLCWFGAWRFVAVMCGEFVVLGLRGWWCLLVVLSLLLVAL